MKVVSTNSDSKVDSKSLFRTLPSVDEVLRLPAVAELAVLEGLPPVLEAARAVLAQMRSEIAASRLDEAGMELAISGIAEAVRRGLQQTFARSLRTVINATGVILHTNLGRAP